MFERILDFLNKIFSSRLRVITCVMMFFSGILIVRLFVLQIINGQQYQDNYDLKVEKKESIEAARGTIYDRNGEVLAYNKLAYAITIEDNGSYESSDDKNQKLNSEIAKIIKNIEKNGDEIDNDFGIVRSATGKYEFTSSSGTQLQRFRADVFGHASIDDLKYNDKLKIDEANASASEIMEYLMGDKRYDISTNYKEALRYKICIVRYNIGQNSYQKYIATTIASDVSEVSVAYIKENMNDLTGVNIKETSVRHYVDSEYFAHIVGYTGTISTEEYEKAHKKDKDVELTDVVGKSGIEQYMNKYLSGKKGNETVYVDNVGNLIQVSDRKESVPGNDVYLSIDKNLQIATYKALEKEIAGIVYSKIANIKTYEPTSDEKDIMIPIYDVYYALINNNLIDIDKFERSSASDTEKTVLHAYNSKLDSVISTLTGQLNTDSPQVYKNLTPEYQEYSTYIVTSLKPQGIFDAKAIDTADDIYKQWTDESLSVNEYLKYAIEKNWIDITKYSETSRYADTDELYNQLVSYMLTFLQSDRGFQKLIYKYLIQEDSISGNQLCAILYEQGVLKDDGKKEALLSGSLSAYSFMLDSIKTLRITPGQLALDPCSGSAVVLNSTTGEVLACVTYPGYDNNKLANSVDSDYYSYLSTSQSNPLYNYATQQRTAPGSTFKVISATAGLAENQITTSTLIDDLGQFDKVSNKPKCWAYPSNHGLINVSEALRVSCNYFFYEVGYDLAGGVNYNDETGIEKLQKYAAMFGLDKKTGIEIEEAKPSIATEYPVMAAIGQSNNNFSTISMARYAAAVASRGNVYDLTLLDHVQNSVSGEVIKTYKPSLRNQVDVLTSEQWSSISGGLRNVVVDLDAFKNLGVEAAGKTGTAQQDPTRPNHALFIGYAPYSSPEIAVATRIAFGYSSGNASVVAADIMSYYFGETTLESLMGSEISGSSSSNAVTD